MIKHVTFVALAAIVLLVVTASMVTVVDAATEEPKTGVSFPDKFKGSALSKTGVRTKGPIKVYAVGQYSDSTFLLQMTYGVNAEKMASALSSALQPRCNDKSKVVEFEQLLLKGLPNGAPKGTKLAFTTGGGKLSLDVNGKNVGTIGSKPLATAFANIYTDKNAVCKLQSLGDDDGGGGGGSHKTMPSFVTPTNCALFFAGIGYGIGKLLN